MRGTTNAQTNHEGLYLPLSGGTVHNTSSTTPLTLKSGNPYYSFIGFTRSTGGTVYLGSFNGKPVFNDGSNHELAYKSDLESIQDQLTIDTVPTSGSNNLITSGAVYDAIQDMEPSPSYSLSSPIVIDAIANSTSAGMSIAYTDSWKYTFSNLYRNGKNITGKITATSVDGGYSGYIDTGNTNSKPIITADLTPIIGTYNGSISISYVLLFADSRNQQNAGAEGYIQTTAVNGIVTFESEHVVNTYPFRYAMSMMMSNIFRMAIYQLTVS